MITSNNSINTFIKQLPRNVFSGFVVSLIALPLGLGLAMASDAPPIAGIITAVLGGIVVSILGGSNVTITGPGNGLVGVLLVAFTTLGVQGAYAAIICSGALLIILGFLRMGKLAEFFPSSAIQGMLAAIGLIILGKQFHIMLGNRLDLDSSIDYLIAIPSTIIGAFQYHDIQLTHAALAGVFALLIMIGYSKIRNKYLQLFPAPMWIVLFSIATSYFYEFVLEEDHPIANEYMIPEIPSASEIIATVPIPDFSLVGSWAFWASVISLTLIASIESLLSIKAVDQLDPQKRRSNVNRDLQALGLATIGSGFAGGLNVVTVIARSSVNVNNGGSNRSSNFAHAIFLVLFVWLFSSQLTRIPLPALMAILVYTGYKLASPKLLKKIATVGKEQLIIFFTTLFTTLFIDLITGIIAGVLVTLLIHIIINKNVLFFLQNVLKPNVLMYKESKGNYYISVKHFCTFLNFYKLKEQLDLIPESEEVVLDLSLTQFIDHTVFENLSNYQSIFQKRGGNFEIIGLDMHGAKSAHPFALRRLIPGMPLIKSNLTKRQKTLQEVATAFKMTYIPQKTEDGNFLTSFRFFRFKKIERVYNRMYNRGKQFKLFDIHYCEGELVTKADVKTTMLHIKFEKVLPEFTLDREGFLERIYGLAGFKDVPIKNHSDFSKRFYLLGEDTVAIQDFFTDDLVRFFESNPYYHIESDGKSLLMFRPNRTAGIKEVKNLIDFGKRLFEVVEKTI